MKNLKIQKLTKEQLQEITKDIVESDMHLRTKNFLIDLIVEANDVSRKSHTP